MGIVDIFVTTWSSEPFIGGAYSTLGVGATSDDRTALSEVLGQRMTFAGEHLSVDHPATMHGAYNSGVAAGQRLIEAQPAAKTAIVIGAGLSGLAAAQTLRSAGLNVTVLEATTHLGGRARTERIWDNRAIHPGAAWIHGPIGNPVADLARSVHIAFPPEPPTTKHLEIAVEHLADGQHRFSSATVLNQLEVDEVLAATTTAHKALAVAAHAHHHNGTPDETIKPTLQKLLNDIESPSIRAVVSTQLMQHFESLLAGSIEDISLHHGDEPYAYPGGDHYITTPLAPLMQSLTDGLTMMFEHPVQAVTLELSSAHVTSTQNYSADVVVVAVPLIPLQRGSITFTPPLPDTMHDSLHKLRMGTKTKVFVRFSEKWWGDTQTIWIYPSTANKAMTAIKATEATSSPLWPEWVDASDVAGVPTLFGFVSGVEGKRIADLATTPEGLAQVRAEVESVFAAIIPALLATRQSGRAIST
jgi:polyamine oxidase